MVTATKYVSLSFHVHMYMLPNSMYNNIMVILDFLLWWLVCIVRGRGGGREGRGGRVGRGELDLEGE